MEEMRFATARPAVVSDLHVLVDLYRSLESEMAPLSDMWSAADGLAEPVGDSLLHELESPSSMVFIGEIDGVPLGFLIARVENVLPQAHGMEVGSIRFVFVDHPAREVGVGEAMRDIALEALRKRGITRFDAHVLPGHRLVKNFFEQGGFSARSIVMHRSE